MFLLVWKEESWNALLLENNQLRNGLIALLSHHIYTVFGYCDTVTAICFGKHNLLHRDSSACLVENVINFKDWTWTKVCVCDESLSEPQWAVVAVPR